MMTNIGPLATTFTPPTDCSWLSVNIVTSPPPASTTFYNYEGIVWPSPLRCFPSSYPYAISDRSSGYYSPGICPSAWTAWSLTSNFPDPAETSAICCPPGFTVYAQHPYDTDYPCFTTHVDHVTTIPALIISGSIDIANRPYGDNAGGFITSSNYPMPGTGWAVYGVQIRYRSGDFNPNKTSSVTSPTSNTANTTPNSSSQSLTTSPSTSLATPTQNGTNNTPTSAADSGGIVLSTGAKIGIGIGVPFAAIIIVIIIAFIIIRRRRRARQAGAPDGPDYKSELPGTIQAAELDATNQQAELGGIAMEEPPTANRSDDIQQAMSHTRSPTEDTIPMSGMTSPTLHTREFAPPRYGFARSDQHTGDYDISPAVSVNAGEDNLEDTKKYRM